MYSLRTGFNRPFFFVMKLSTDLTNPSTRMNVICGVCKPYFIFVKQHFIPIIRAVKRLSNRHTTMSTMKYCDGCAFLNLKQCVPSMLLLDGRCSIAHQCSQRHFPPSLKLNSPSRENCLPSPPTYVPVPDLSIARHIFSGLRCVQPQKLKKMIDNMSTIHVWGL